VEAEAGEDDVDQTLIRDERLGLVVTCCDPALALEAQVALTLRTLGPERRFLGRRLAELQR
jgi:RNA polymerase sigma-70 factor (ECF subfamily)